MTRVLIAWTLFSIAVCLILASVGEYVFWNNCAEDPVLCIPRGFSMFVVFLYGFVIWLIGAGAIVLVGLLWWLFR